MQKAQTTKEQSSLRKLGAFFFFLIAKKHQEIVGSSTEQEK